MRKAIKALTIKEKKQLILEGKDVPVCVFEDPKAEKKQKKEQKKLAKTFAKNVLK